MIFILGVVIVAVLSWVFLPRGKARSAPKTPPAPAIATPPAPPKAIPTLPEQARPAALTVRDEDDVERREIDTATLQHARSAVTSAVPDAVLADALQHTDAKYLAHAFAGIDAAVLAAAIGEVPRHSEQTVRPEDRKALIGVETAVDDLDIWSFGES